MAYSAGRVVCVHIGTIHIGYLVWGGCFSGRSHTLDELRLNEILIWCILMVQQADIWVKGQGSHYNILLPEKRVWKSTGQSIHMYISYRSSSFVYLMHIVPCSYRTHMSRQTDSYSSTSTFQKRRMDHWSRHRWNRNAQREKQRHAQHSTALHCTACTTLHCTALDWTKTNLVKQQ